MRHIAVNFHYVGMPAMPHPGIHGLDEERLADCLRTLGQAYSFVSLRDVAAAVAGKAGGDRVGCGCLVTFDDGLRCQYERALPVLDRLGIPAAFFVLGGPYLNGRATTVHKLHFSRAALGDVEMKAMVDGMCRERGIEKTPDSVDLAVVRESYRYDGEASARLKYFLNYLMPEDFVEEAVTKAFQRIGMSEPEFIDRCYMTPAMIADLGKRGMIGSHAVSHRPLAKLGAGQLSEELATSKRFLEEVTGDPIAAVSYPLGNKEAVDPEVAERASRTGYVFGYTMERAQNLSVKNPLLLARFDASDAPKLRNRDDLPTRARYFKE
jgi:peptidoglycan/xylan/chitin deacetylase (PgdA/CDA1 family)